LNTDRRALARHGRHRGRPFALPWSVRSREPTDQRTAGSAPASPACRPRRPSRASHL